MQPFPTNKTANHISDYEIVPLEETKCVTRTDDRGILSRLKAWYIFILHSAACVSLFVGLQFMHNQTFNTGSPPGSAFEFSKGLYQTQISALISVALVIIRILWSSCAALLIWRTIYVLLEKRHITLTELTHLSSYQIPVVPTSKSNVGWSIWATIAIVFLWPPSFAAPLANSAVAWIPSTRLAYQSQIVKLPESSTNLDFADLTYNDWQLETLVRAAYMTGKDPKYAFDVNAPLLRRYFSPEETMSEGSHIDILAPYLNVSIRWIDYFEDKNITMKATEPNYTNIMQNGVSIRKNGAMGIIRHEKWDADTARPTEAHIFQGTKHVFMKVATLDSDNPLEDGTFANETTPCPGNSKDFGKLPSVQQLEKHWTWQKRQWAGKDCYLIGRATITAGTYFCTDCIVSPANSTEHSATCQVDERNSTIQRDFLTNLSLDFMSETLKYSTLLNFTSAYTKRGADHYVMGMLRLGYHAAWSSMRRKWDFGREEVRLQAAQPVVRADIDFIRLYVWLAMNATLELAAIAVYLALLVCKVKTVRDTTIAALTMDLGDVMHGAKGRGLCNAASSGKEDKHLPPLRWKDKEEFHRESGIGFGGEKECDVRKVEFVEGGR